MAARRADDGGRDAPLELGPLYLVFADAGLAANLITASKSFPGRDRYSLHLSRSGGVALGLDSSLLVMVACCRQSLTVFRGVFGRLETQTLISSIVGSR